MFARVVESIARDARFARRSLLRTPIVAATAVISIALGIASTTAVDSIVDAALFRPPPFDRPERLVALYITRQRDGGTPQNERWSWRRYQRLLGATQSLQGAASFSQSVLAITSGEPEPVNAEVVSSSYLQTLEIVPFAGHGFEPADDDPSTARPVALIGFDLWQRRFGGDRGIIGRALGVNGVPLTVIGVLPRGFSGLTGRGALWIPPPMAARVSYADYQITNQNFISVVGRLKPDVPVQRLRSELGVGGPAIQRADPSTVSNAADRLSATAISLADARIDPSTRVPMLVLLGGAACLLLLSCANVAGLLLGRAVSRRQEIAIRTATGATRGRIVRGLLVEALLLAAAGGGLGVVLALPAVASLQLPHSAWRGRNFYGAISEFAVPRIDARVLIFAAIVCAVTVVACGLFPALQATRVDVSSLLRNGSASARRRPLLDPRRLIVGAETALALALLAIGGDLAAAWRRFATTATGFDRTHVLTFLVRPSEPTYPPAKAPALLSRVVAAIDAVPGVEAASVDGCAPVGTGCASSTLFVVGRSEPRPDDAPPVLRHYVGPDHFRVLGIPVLRGRTFDAGDRAGSNRVTIINELAARRFWPNEDPIGKRVWFGGGSNFDRPDSSAEIVGIVGDAAYQSLDNHPFQPDFYTPYAQFTYATRTVLVRTAGNPLSAVTDIRRAVAGVDPALALFDVRALDDLVGDSWARLGYQTRILAGFAIVALLLAATGIFAIIAAAIGDRRREIGVRIALGASSSQVLSSMARHGASPAFVGLAAGVFLALLGGRVVAASVFGVRAADPLALSAAAALVTIATMAATLLAARRALLVSAAAALKAE